MVGNKSVTLHTADFQINGVIHVLFHRVVSTAGVDVSGVARGLGKNQFAAVDTNLWNVVVQVTDIFVIIQSEEMFR